jgi:alkylation response protein AidB-like acyl-CoA dehydrogenase
MQSWPCFYVTISMDEAVRRAREIAEGVAAALVERTDREGRWPEESFRALQDGGLGGLVVPVHSGGLGLGLEALARVCEQIALVCPSTAISFGMHHVAAAVIAAKATPEQTAQYLEPIARGKHLTTLALSEPATGAHFYIPRTPLTDRPGGGFEITGQKSFVTNGSHADSYVVSVVAVDAEADPGRFSCVIVPKDAKGITWGEPWAGLGMRGNDSRTLDLERVLVPRAGLLGEPGDQIWYVFNIVAPYFLIAMAGTYLGIATAALEEGRAHLASRHYAHSGTSLAQQPVLQHRLGVLWAKVARCRALVLHAARSGDVGAADALPSLCSAKAEVADTVVDVVNETMTLLGGKGYASDSRIHRMMRDARAAHVMSPTTDLLRTWTGRALLGLPLLAD